MQSKRRVVLRVARKILIITLLTIIVTLSAVEIFVRAKPLIADNFTLYAADYGWHYNPDFQGNYVSLLCPSEFTTSPRFNSVGLRDIEQPFEPATDMTQVLLLGDSIVAALEVDLEQTTGYQLRELLNQNGSYSVVNGGMTGFGATNELLFYQHEGVRYQPDVVILFFEPQNDVMDNFYRASWFPYFTLDEAQSLVFHPATENPPGNGNYWNVQPVNPLHQALWYSSYLYRFLSERRKVSTILQENTTPEGTLEQTQRAQTALPITLALIEELHTQVLANGTVLGVVINPSIYDVEADHELHQIMQEALNRYGIPHLDLHSTFHSEPVSPVPLRFGCDWHWTAAGHSVVAPLVADFVRSLR